MRKPHLPPGRGFSAEPGHAGTLVTLQNCEAWLCCFTHLICGNVLWQPEWTKVGPPWPPGATWLTFSRWKLEVQKAKRPSPACRSLCTCPGESVLLLLRLTSSQSVRKRLSPASVRPSSPGSPGRECFSLDSQFRPDCCLISLRTAQPAL